MNSRIPWIPSKRQEKIMLEEIKKQIRVEDEKHFDDTVIMFLYAIHIELGFGKKRLRRMFDRFDKIHQDLLDHYDMNGDAPWLCRKKLKDIGVDLDEWRGGKK